MEVVDKVVDFFIWLCIQTPPSIEEDSNESKESKESKEPKVITEEEKNLLWKNYFTMSEKLEELAKNLDEEPNPVIQGGLRKSITTLKRRLTYNANKLKLL